MCLQFLQLRKSVVLTSNFAKSVVNLADMVRGGSWKEFVPGRVNPWHLMVLSLGDFIPLHSQGIYPQWAYSWREDLSPILVGLSLGGVILEGTVPSSWICSQGVCP